jgi:hypothetical protein
MTKQAAHTHHSKQTGETGIAAAHGVRHYPANQSMIPKSGVFGNDHAQAIS